MRKLLQQVFITIIFISSIATTAQAKLIGFGIGLEGGLPNGDAKDLYTVIGGATARLAIKAGPGYVTATSGGLVFAPKLIQGVDNKAGLQIPIKFGYKYVFAGHIYAMMELGYSNFTFYSVDAGNNLVSEKSGGFTYAPGVGVQILKLDIGLRYESFSIKPEGADNTNINFIALRLGFNIL